MRTSLQNLTQDVVAELYFGSLGNVKTRISHVLLKPKIGEAAVPTPVPSGHDVEIDFTSWYGGLCALAHGLDPGIDLPSLREMLEVIGRGLERAKSAIAA
jgi:hypothetical protein